MERPLVGQSQELEPGLRAVLAPNPSPMTHWGTNTFLLGEGDITVIDPGPAIAAHMAAILAALHPGERIARILVTHAHMDHAPLAAALSRVTGATIMAFGPAGSGATPSGGVEADLGGGEGVDRNFRPDETLRHGDRIEAGGCALAVHHTPGHMAEHLCFAWQDRLFSGDHVMGWAPSLVSPPDGDMSAYMAALERLAAGNWSRLYPAHGAPVEDPAARIAELLAHRRAREAAILEALAPGPATLQELTARVYHDVRPELLLAASRNLLAHLIDLAARNRISAAPSMSPAARFSRK